MAYTLDADVSGSIDIDEYIDFVTRTVDLNDEDSILESASMLKALSNNSEFIATRFNDELLAWSEFQTGNGYSSQTLMLGQGEKFAVRANMWVPTGADRDIWDWESHLYAYSRPHDHNFSFMTVGYFGPGYETSIYEYDPRAVVGTAGETVDLEFLEDTSLPAGKVMFYRASRDIHVQAPPPAFSMSINLMIVSADFGSRDQYWFDLESQKVTGHVQTPAASQMLMCHLARWFASDSTMDTLDHLTERAINPRVRLAALDSLAAMQPGERETLVRRAADDPSPLVQDFANGTPSDGPT
ncbi:hypothetical protein [Nocardioides plantarum]|uniref:HEAT repeat domain-containing protein n=1 Tax=Nocardioides plantarum TaxID=29299 RepID=A0ABV5K6M2_9ACTN|nr:hypothetical protein [Nocardioides plantarum]